jgi:protein O-mannosyl-transferase
MKIRLQAKFGLAAFTAFLTFLVYLPALQNDFVNWDDNTYVVDNPYLRSFDLSFLKWAFLDFYSSNWHPLTWMSHALDYAVWGLNPLGHHLTNNILHALNTFLVVLLVAKLIEVTTPTPPYHGGELHGEFTIHDPRFTWVAAGVTGLFFGLHPLHVESVAWVAERKDLLCAFFYLLSVMAYTRYAGRSGPMRPKEGQPHRVAPTRTYIISLCLLILALMSKPMAVSLPVVLLILDWYPFKIITSIKTFRTSLIGKIPFIVLSFFSSMITILAQRSGEAIKSSEFATLQTRLFVAGKSLISYLWSMLLPLNLTPFYAYPQKISPLSIEYLLPLVFIAGLSMACLLIAKKQELWMSAWSYYALTLLPVLGIIQVGEQAMADRYVYLPSLGPFLIVGIVAAWVLKKVDTLYRLSRGPMIFSFAAVIFLSLSMSYLTVQQIGIWKNSFTLWTFVIDKAPDRVPFAYYNRGLFFAKIGQYRESIEDFDRAIFLLPFGHSEYYNNRGVSRMNEKLFDQAIEDFNVALALDPDNNSAHYNLGLAYYRRGSSLAAAGKKELAGPDLQRACNLGNKKGCSALHALES